MYAEGPESLIAGPEVLGELGWEALEGGPGLRGPAGRPWQALQGPEVMKGGGEKSGAAELPLQLLGRLIPKFARRGGPKTSQSFDHQV